MSEQDSQFLFSFESKINFQSKIETILFDRFLIYISRRSHLLRYIQYIADMKQRQKFVYQENNLELDQMTEGLQPKRSQFKVGNEIVGSPNQCYMHKDIKGNYIDTRGKGSYKYPNSAIGVIKIGDQLFGTGFLIRSNIVMTCAHNCYSRTANKIYQGLSFYIGGQKQKRKCYKVKKAYYPKQYESAGRQKGSEEDKFLYDYAILELLQQTEDQYGTLGVKFSKQINQFKVEQNKDKKKVVISGFPHKILGFQQNSIQKQKKKFGNQQSISEKKEEQPNEIINKNQDIYQESGQISGVDQKLKVLNYKITTTEGQSGSPILQKDNGKYYVRGIHIYGDQRAEQNKGVILDNDKRNQINIWIGKSTGILDISQNQNWLSVLKHQKFKKITQLKLGRVLSDEFLQITQQKVIGKLKQLQELKIQLTQVSHLQEITKVCNQFQQLKRVYFEFCQYGESIQQVKTDKICQTKFISSFRFFCNPSSKMINIIEMINKDKNQQKQKTDKFKQNLFRTFINTVVRQFKNVDILNLSQNKITQTPTQIANLINLQQLLLSRNELTNIPKEIGNLINLKELQLNYNKIQQLPTEIGNMVKLKKLYLMHNKIRQLPAEIGNLVDLQILILNHNQLSQLPRELGNLFKLQDLVVQDNPLKELSKYLESELNLESLDLSYNQLKQLPSEIRNLVKLKNLLLNSSSKHNQLTQLPKEIGCLVNVQALFCVSNKIAHLPKEIGGMTNLVILYLSKNKITQLPCELGNLPRLQELYLQENKLKSFQKCTVQGKKLYTNLVVLDISRNLLQTIDAWVIQLITEHKLETLNISYNNLKKLPTNFSNCVNNKVNSNKDIKISFQRNPDVFKQNPVSKRFRLISCKKQEGKQVDEKQLKNVLQKNKQILTQVKKIYSHEQIEQQYKELIKKYEAMNIKM